MVHLIFTVPWLFVSSRFIYPLKLNSKIKWTLCVVFFIASQQHLWARLSSGSVFSPEFPRPIVIALSVVFATLVLTALFQLVADIVCLVGSAITRRWIKIPTQVRLGSLAALFLLAVFASYNAMKVPDLNEVEIEVAELPKEFDGYRLIHLTDLHISKLFQAPWAQAVVEKTNAQNADVILITGDLMDGYLDNRREDIEPLRGLRAKDGVYVTAGNHEYFFGHDEWMNHYAEMGMKVLDNSHAILNHNGAQVVLAGVTDVTAIMHDREGPNFKKSIEGAPQDTSVILMDHQPMFAIRNAEEGADLQLSGHTHGGMIAGLAEVIAQFNNGFISGLYTVGTMKLYVNNGTALWPGFAIRLGKPSELTVITLRAPKT